VRRPLHTGFCVFSSHLNGFGSVHTRQPGLSPGALRLLLGKTHWLLRNTLPGGNADKDVLYGRAGDVPVVGNWDGKNGISIGGVRGTTLLLKDSLAGGAADYRTTYGRAGDTPVVGDWARRWRRLCRRPGRGGGRSADLQVISAY
jgi:hypothetical protein